MRIYGVLTAALLAGCPTVDLGDPPSDLGVCNPKGGLGYFQNSVWPMYLRVSGAKDCGQSSSCHQMAHGMALDTATPVDYAANYKVAQQFLNCGTPMASIMFTKPTGFDGHGGGVLFPANGPEATVFLGWFQ